jgi:vitamin K-dependent gamma-carboxylase
MMIDIPQERGMSSIGNRWEDSTLCIFPLFDWLQPLPVDWMYVVYLVMFMAAFGIALGWYKTLDNENIPKGIIFPFKSNGT